MSLQATIIAMLTGKVRPFRGPDEPSAIAKQPVPGPVSIGPLGLEGDEQADRAAHGGPDKAIHQYPYDHYDFWRGEIGDHPLLRGPGAFGENISALGMTEDAVCVGDRFRIGTALVEVSQGRQPCWKQGHRLGRPEVTARIVESRRCGWYYRVIEAGVAAAGDGIALVDRVLPEWSVERVFTLLIAGGHRADRQAVAHLAALEILAEPWRLRATHLLSH